MFSVVIPVWNKQHTIARTLASVLAQSYRDFELIVVDDGSTDGGAGRLAAFDDVRLRLISQAHAGPGAARNTGIAAASHDWVALLDADDIWLPDHLDELARIRARHPGAGLIGTSCVCSALGKAPDPPAPRAGRIALVDYFDRIGRGDRLFCTSSAALPKSSYLAIGGFGPAPVAQDAEYWARIALARDVAVSSRVTVVYQLGTGGISDTARSLWFGRPLRSTRDLGPSVALLLDRYPEIRSAETRAAIDRYIDRRYQGCVRRSAYLEDIQTLRALPDLAVRPPGPADRLILAIARLPRPLACAIYRLGFRAKALLRLAGRFAPRLRPGGEWRIWGAGAPGMPTTAAGSSQSGAS